MSVAEIIWLEQRERMEEKTKPLTRSLFSLFSVFLSCSLAIKLASEREKAAGDERTTLYLLFIAPFVPLLLLGPRKTEEL